MIFSVDARQVWPESEPREGLRWVASVLGVIRKDLLVSSTRRIARGVSRACANTNGGVELEGDHPESSYRKERSDVQRVSLCSRWTSFGYDLTGSRNRGVFPVIDGSMSNFAKRKSQVLVVLSGQSGPTGEKAERSGAHVVGSICRSVDSHGAKRSSAHTGTAASVLDGSTWNGLKPQRGDGRSTSTIPSLIGAGRTMCAFSLKKLYGSGISRLSRVEFAA